MYKYKGNYSALITYEVGDCVTYQDGLAYHLRKAIGRAGVSPANSDSWGQLGKIALFAIQIAESTAESVAVDTFGKGLANNLTTATAGKALDATQGKALKDALDALTLRVAALEPEAEPASGGGDG